METRGNTGILEQEKTAFPCSQIEKNIFEILSKEDRSLISVPARSIKPYGDLKLHVSGSDCGGGGSRSINLGNVK